MDSFGGAACKLDLEIFRYDIPIRERKRLCPSLLSLPAGLVKGLHYRFTFLVSEAIGAIVL